eukprot:Gregarina_sp_Poly_1__9395@NODE_587_length_7368_cov_122_746473_g453_i0_p3_GENE_NODE_587_length_7368_cov_122_746473_g453_i0NODE_587_length_7368_cov_122_746473_g453_i0_p3_ORF_typecomplete_len406_score61_11zfC2H2_2/PF12756_7/5_7e02zfC2H2_2/PF12756_7/8_7e26zfC2H2_4/PF13894_6/1_6e03zfC2H2_4/PF13894_6/0_0047zfC2H2_11/PF16622_5/0_04zfC2H2_6/PF13912_6/0_018Kinesin_assoc/PF16183_5/95Kinesin_assoc/PF16183_5/1_9zfC2H2_jaz/PF12171_8/4_2e03zfC2H2_jaz/PF12171_8/0_17OrsD/PF12013_8/7e02OrsD/PF12013_8/0_7zfC2H2_3
MFSCVPCLLAFENRELQIAHVRSDLHQYNLKRRLADLPPITVEEYSRKLELLEDGATVFPATKSVSRKRKEGHRLRQKTVNANHLIDRAVRLRPVKETEACSDGFLSEADEGRIVSSASQRQRATVVRVEKYDPRFCLFDNQVAESFDENLKHMKLHHSLHIHDAEYLKDLLGFITYLGRKVFEGHQCLYCNKGFRSVEAVRKHMIDSGHTRIGTHLEEHEVEYEDFYDYITSFKELNIPDSVKQLLPLEFAPDDDEWEVVEEYEEDQDTEEQDITVINEISTVARNSEKRVDCDSVTWEEKLLEFGYRRAFVNESGNLTLPSDKVVPHRMYYRKGRVIMPRRRVTNKQVAPLMLPAKANSTWVERTSALSRARLTKSKQLSEMRLGVKSNKLYRYIARKNKIFI